MTDDDILKQIAQDGKRIAKRITDKLGLKVKTGLVTRASYEDNRELIEAMKNDDRDKMEKFTVVVSDLYSTFMPKLEVKQGNKKKTIDVEISSSKTDDEAILHQLQRKVK